MYTEYSVGMKNGYTMKNVDSRHLNRRLLALLLGLLLLLSNFSTAFAVDSESPKADTQEQTTDITESQDQETDKASETVAEDLPETKEDIVVPEYKEEQKVVKKESAPMKAMGGNVPMLGATPSADDVAGVTIGGTTEYYASLAEAVTAAKAASGDVTITVLQNVTIDSATARMDFGDADRLVTIQSSAGNKFTITKNYNGTNSPIRGKNLVLKDIILDGNKLPAKYRSATTGGGVQVRANGTLLMDNASVINCMIYGGGTNEPRGGGIYGFPGSTITLTNGSLVQGNEALGDGGGIYGETIIIENSSVLDNISGEIKATNQSNNYESKNGGGIYASGSVTIKGNSEISGNTAAGKGGGINVGSGSSLINIEGNVQIANNTQGTGSSETDSNLYIDGGSSKFDRIYITGNLGDDASIGISIADGYGNVLDPEENGGVFAHTDNGNTYDGMHHIFYDLDPTYAASGISNGTIVFEGMYVKVIYLDAQTGVEKQQQIIRESIITINPNGGTVDGHTDTYTTTLTGSTFAVPTGTKAYTLFKGYSFNQATNTFTAQWEKLVTTVSYKDENGEASSKTMDAGAVIKLELNGGTFDGTSGDRTLIVDGETMPIEDAGREGYRFEGWDLRTGTTETYIFTAIWTLVHKVTYLDASKNPAESSEELIPDGSKIRINLNGGHINGNYSNLEPVITSEYPINITPEREDYIFKGWIMSEGTDDIYVVFTAEWEEDQLKIRYKSPEEGDTYILVDRNIKIQINPNNGKWNGNEAIQTKTIIESYRIEGDPVRPGFDFLGWTCTAGTKKSRMVSCAVPMMVVNHGLITITKTQHFVTQLHI